ncbi:MAG: DUF58 domain-containing protein [Gemmatimonadaceae bacterium]
MPGRLGAFALFFLALAIGAAFFWIVARVRLTPTRRCGAVLALTAPLWLLSGWPAGLVIAFAALVLVAALMLADAVMLPARSRVTVTRVLPSSVGLGETIEGSYSLHSDWPRPLRADLFDALPHALELYSAGTRTLDIAPHQSVGSAFTVRARERGVYELGPVALRVRGTFGLVQRTLVFDLHDTLTVVPSMAGVRRYRLLSLQHRLRDAGIRTIRRRGDGTSFANLRDYARGDDPRHIDWKATARRGRVITREFTVEQGQTVMIAVDAGRLMTQLAGSLPRFEYAVSAALLLADVAAHSGDRVGIIVFDDEVQALVRPERGRLALERVRDALAGARASMTEPDYAAAFRTLATSHHKRSLIVIFSDVIDSRSSRALIAHTTRSTVRHLPLLIALRNDALIAAAEPAVRASTAAIYESAAAEEMLLARDQALACMRAAGVAVLDVSPRDMSAPLINRYLDIKARASL